MTDKKVVVSISAIKEVTSIINEFSDDILTLIEGMVAAKTDASKYSFVHDRIRYQLEFRQTVLVEDEELDGMSMEISPVISIPVRKITILFNNEFIGDLTLSRDDVVSGISQEDKLFTIGFITSQITRLAFSKWYELNISKTGFQFTNLMEYSNFIKTMLKRVGYTLQISWDGSVFNFSIFKEEPFMILVQQNTFTAPDFSLSEQEHLGNVRCAVSSVYFDLFRKGILGDNIKVEINEVE